MRNVNVNDVVRGLLAHVQGPACQYILHDDSVRQAGASGFMYMHLCLVRSGRVVGDRLQTSSEIAHCVVKHIRSGGVVGERKHDEFRLNIINCSLRPYMGSLSKQPKDCANRVGDIFADIFVIW